MKKLEFFLATKFLLNIKKERSISVMIKICFISILISSFALTLICAIMNGFEKATYKKLQSIHSDIVINSRFKEIDFEKLKPIILDNFGKYIKALSPFSIGQIILKSNHHSLAMIKAVDPKTEPLVNNLDSMLIKRYKNIKDWSKLLKKKSIFIGENLAKNLKVDIGDKLNLLYPDQNIANNNINLNLEPVKVTGIFKTGIQELDEHIIISSLDFFRDIFDYGITGINLKLNKKFKENKDIIKDLKDKLKLEVYSWKDLYPAIVSALALEKVAMLTILSLITLLALINIISLIFMLITQKKKDIAILKFNGMKDSSIKYIFIIISLIITSFASILGITLASIVSYLLNNYKLVKVPDAYYVDYLPSSLNIKIILIIFFSIVLTSLIISIIPIRKIKDLNIAQILKDEI